MHLIFLSLAFLVFHVAFAWKDIESAIETLEGPNILLVLADDLGYSDLSVPGFSGGGVKTPELFKMAEDGLTMTNFHVAAPICTPSRAAILTGLFSWRLGIHAIYGSGKQANEHLPVIPNAPLLFANADYHTVHVGKWHLGGLRPSDVQKRSYNACGSAHPGPNQHGFQDYVAMEEGPGSMRLTHLVQHGLYHKGAKYLIQNDKPIVPTEDILTSRQADEAIRLMNETITKGKKFYMHLWFDAPHLPLEYIEEFGPLYETSKVEVKKHTADVKYKTMISSLDAAVGRIRRAIRLMGIEKDTLIVFLSDNGPENAAGSAIPFQGRKRSLHEGGIRVPCIWQWKGKISPGTTTNHFSVSTDLLPTFLEMANIKKPNYLKLDGQSLASILLMNRYSRPGIPAPKLVSTGKEGEKYGDERVVTWFNNIVGCTGAVWTNGQKYMFDNKGNQHFYNMRNDPLENNELIPFNGIIAVSTDNKILIRSKPTLPGNDRSFNYSLSERSKGLIDISQNLQKQCYFFIEHGNKAYMRRKDVKFCGVGKLEKVQSLPWDVSKSYPGF